MALGSNEERERPNRWTRRDVLKLAGLVGISACEVYVNLIAPGLERKPNSRPSVLDPNQALSDLAARSQGEPIVGNAVGRYPEQIIRLVQDATNVLVVMYAGTDVASIGTAWKAQLGEQVSNDEITLATAGHVLTDHGQHSLSEIQAVWIGHAHSSNSFVPLDPRALRMSFAPQASRADAKHDMGTIRMPKQAAPDQLAAASALRLATPGEVPSGTPLLVTGVPVVFVTQYSAAGIESTSLYAQVMRARYGQGIPNGCFGLEGPSGNGMSGASVVGPEGQVVGVAIDSLLGSTYTTVAAPVNALRQLE